MKELLRKRELIEAVGVPKSTIADWIIEFRVYIPTVQQGSVTYYRPAANPVLMAIKELREKQYAKPDIMRELMQRGFAIEVPQEGDDIRDIILDRQSAPDGQMLDMMRKSMYRLQQHSSLLQRHHQRFQLQDKRLETHDEELEGIRKELHEVKKELAATKAILARKPWWKRLWSRS